MPEAVIFDRVVGVRQLERNRGRLTIAAVNGRGNRKLTVPNTPWLGSESTVATPATGATGEAAVSRSRDCRLPSTEVERGGSAGSA